MPRAILVVFAVLAIPCLLLTGCNDDSVSPPKDPPPEPTYQDLSEESHVLNNLELSCNEMNITEYGKLFDPQNFVFHFSESDVGGEIPEQWGATEELIATRNMFTDGGGRGSNPILSIELRLTYGGLEWETVSLEDFPGEEIRRIAGVVYDFRIHTRNETTYITSGSPKADFYVRKIDDKWTLVDWFDRADASARAAASATEESSWGTVKVLYR